MSIAVVTGANGFVGTALVRELSRRSGKVYAVVRGERSNISQLRNISNVHVIYCSMENLDLLPDHIHEQADIFYHLAWSGSTGGDRGDYVLQLQNVKWTLDAVGVAKKLGCKRFVGAGTLAEYDVQAYTPLDGSTPNRVSCYGVAKMSAHYMSKAECCQHGLEHVWAFLSNTYGEGNFTSNFVNFAVRTMLSGKKAEFTSGEQYYDFVHVKDTAQGLACIGEKGKRNCSYYIGSGFPAQLKEFIIRIRDAIDPSIELHLGAIPFNGVSHPLSVFGCRKLMEDTGYLPSVSFCDGISGTVRWIQEQLKKGTL